MSAPGNRVLSPLGAGVALGVTLIAVFVLCAIVVLIAPSLRFTHAWIGLFTLAPVTSPVAWLEGTFFSLVLGSIGGAIFALVHNAIATKGL